MTIFVERSLLHLDTKSLKELVCHSKLNYTAVVADHNQLYILEEVVKHDHFASFFLHLLQWNVCLIIAEQGSKWLSMEMLLKASCNQMAPKSWNHYGWFQFRRNLLTYP